MENTITQRVRLVFKQKDITANSFAPIAKMQQTTISRQLRGDNPISCMLLEAVLTIYPDISAEWLMRGEGEMMCKPSVPVQDESWWKRVVGALTDTCEDQRQQIEKLKELKAKSDGV